MVCASIERKGGTSSVRGLSADPSLVFVGILEVISKIENVEGLKCAAQTTSQIIPTECGKGPPR